MDYFSGLCNVIIKPKGKYKLPKSKTHKKIR